MSEPDTNRPMDAIPSADYVKIGDNTFSLVPIANQEVSIEAELKEFYNEQYKNHVERFNDGIVAGIDGDWTRQLNKLREHSQHASVIVPSQLFNKAVVCLDGSTVEPIRITMYSPDVFKMTKYDIISALNLATTSVRTSAHSSDLHIEGKLILKDKTEVDLNAIRGDRTLLVTVEQVFFFPALYSFNSAMNRLSCHNMITFHNQGDRICTGRHKASDFWASNEFERLMNIVNCFSLGSRHVWATHDRQGEGLQISDYVNLDSIISIEEEGRNRWTT